MAGCKRGAWRRRAAKALAAAAAVASVCPADALGGWAELGHVPAHRALAGPSEGARRPAHAERGASRGGMAFASSMEWMGERVGKKVEELQDALKNKRLELCPWEEFGIECEKAATYAQLWINPCQVRPPPPALPPHDQAALPTHDRCGAPSLETPEGAADPPTPSPALGPQAAASLAQPLGNRAHPPPPLPASTSFAAR